MSKDILIIDDEEIYLEPVFEKLKIEGLTYDYCSNGSKGLAKLESTDYRLIILDIHVGLGEKLEHITGYFKKGGLYILEKIREMKPSLPVICYTIYSKKDKDIIERILELGGKHLEKGKNTPMTILIDEIKKIINSAMEDKI